MHRPIGETVGEALMLGERRVVELGFAPGHGPGALHPCPHRRLVALGRLLRALRLHAFERARHAGPVRRIQQHVAPGIHRGHSRQPLRRRSGCTTHDEGIGNEKTIEGEARAQIVQDRSRKRGRRSARVPLRISNKCGHHTPYTNLHDLHKRIHIGLLQLGSSRVDNGEPFVRIGRSAAMPRVVLGARHGAVLLTALDPRRRVPSNGRRIRTKGPRLNDGIAWLDVEVAHRRKHPVDSHRACFCRGDRPTRVSRSDVVDVAERPRRRQLGQAAHLLPRPALEVGGEQQWATCCSAQRAGECRDRSASPAEQNEPADARGERLANLGTF